MLITLVLSLSFFVLLLLLANIYLFTLFVQVRNELIEVREELSLAKKRIYAQQTFLDLKAEHALRN